MCSENETIKASQQRARECSINPPAAAEEPWLPITQILAIYMNNNQACLQESLPHSVIYRRLSIFK